MATKAKSWLRSKTVWVAVLYALAGVSGIVADFLEAGDFTQPAIIALMTSVLMLVLRKMTSQPIA